MALQISSYVDPGVYIGQVIVPGAVNIATTPVQLGIIGVGDRNQTIANEALQRGLVEEETLTFSAPTGTGTAITAPVSTVQTLTNVSAAFGIDVIGLNITIRGATNATNNGTFPITDRTATTVSYVNAGGVVEGSYTGTWSISPHATLANRSTRALQNTTLFRNGTAVSTNFVSYPRAFVQGTVTATRNFTAPNNTFTFQLDGKVPLTLVFVPAPAAAAPTGPFVAGAGVTTIPVTAALPELVGHSITIASATSGANNGTFTITATTATTITYNNAAGVSEAVGAATFLIVAGTLVQRAATSTQWSYTAATPTVVTMATIATVLNTLLVAATDSALGVSGYGAAYAAAVTSGTDGLRITSPLSTPAGDVRVFPGPSDATHADVNGNAASRFFTATTVDADSVVAVSSLVYAASATYTATYLDLTSTSDPLGNDEVQAITKVGRFAGVGNYAEGTDFALGDDAIEWGGPSVPPELPAQFPSSGIVGTSSATFDLSTNDRLSLAFDGGPAVDIDLVGLASAPVGYVTIGAPATAARADVITNINAIFAAHPSYGARYQAVASAATLSGSTFILLRSPDTLTGTSGAATSVTISAPATLGATTTIFGLQTTQLPAVRLGSGAKPTLGSLYYITYTITRPASAYNVQKRFFTLDSARADLGSASAENPLVVALEIAFANQAPSVVVVQVDDATVTGSPTRAEFADALEATTNSDVITDVVVLSTSLDVQTDLKDHIENQSSPTEKQFRRGWYGLARSTDIGDKDTPDTYVYMATRTLQYAPDSPGRGRAILVAPPQLTGVSRTITLSDGSQVTLDLDSTYLAVALAAKKSSFLSPATSLAKKTITGFNLSDVTAAWKKAERASLAGQGCMVVTYDAGLFKVLDPVTTEAGGGGLAAFKYESTTSQTDNVSRKVEQALDANVVGIVPTDLSDFIIDIKLIIAAVLNGEIGAAAIGAFTNADKTTRPIDLTTDLVVQQDPNDPTKFFFQYWYNLRYPALRLFGEFSVDSPFFSSQAA